jgi:hypothetical protein
VDERDDDLLDIDQLLDEGLSVDEALAVLGGATAVYRWEARERYEMLQRERRDSR